MSEPNRENIRAWVDALRSGEYEQGSCELLGRDTEGERYCCLGVASRLAIDNGVPILIEWDNSIDQAAFVRVEDSGTFGERSVLPAPVAEWLGLDDPNPMVEVDVEGLMLRGSFDLPPHQAHALRELARLEVERRVTT